MWFADYIGQMWSVGALYVFRRGISYTQAEGGLKRTSVYGMMDLSLK
jgi:hypothetical protein